MVECYADIFIPASNEPSGCLQTFGDCREVFDLCVMTGFLSLSSKGVICIEAACAFINGNIVTQSFLVVQGD